MADPSLQSAKTLPLLQRKILVVDDQEVMRNVIASHLRNAAFESVTVASNGTDALRLLLEQRFDAVVSHLDMPKMSGLQLLQAIRSNERLSHLQFLLITGNLQRETMNAAIAAGLGGVLVKPFTAASLTERVVRLLQAPPPVVRSAPHAPNELPHAELVQPKATVLVVDDQPDSLHLITALLQNEYQLKIARDGEKAISLCISENPPDLILLDIMMPGLDGFEVARRLREHPTSESIPIIFITASHEEPLRQKAMALGAVDFITKPASPSALLPRIRNFMRYVALHKRLQGEMDGMLAMARLRDEMEKISRHDMNEPLTSIVSIARRLQSDAAISRHQGDALRQIEAIADGLIEQLQLSSDLYRIQTGSFRFSPQAIDLENLLRQVVALARESFADKQLHLLLDIESSLDKPLPMASGDPRLCRALFQGLLQHACSSALADAKIELSLRDNDGQLSIELHFHGLIPPAQRAHYFERTSQGADHLVCQDKPFVARLLCEAQSGSISLLCDDLTHQSSLCVVLPATREKPISKEKHLP